MHTEHGFTLTELMITIMIVGILAAAATPFYGSYLEKNKVIEAVAVLQTCRRQVDLAYQETEAFPTTVCGTAKAATTTINANTVYQLNYDYTTSPEQVWIAAYLQSSVLSDITNASEAVIHIGAAYSADEDKLIWYCGRWDNNFLSDNIINELLPDDCKTNGVQAAMNAVT